MAWRRKNKHLNISLLKILLLLIVVYIVVIAVRGLHKSIIFTKPDRLNVVFYGENPTLVSIGLFDNVDYLANFNNSLKFIIPGGYGYYNVGSIGKLSDIEKNPDLIKRSFSWAMSASVDFYFSPKNPVVYRPVRSADNSDNAMMPQISIPGLFFGRGLKTNANIVERIFVWYLFATRSKKDFYVIKTDFISRSQDVPGESLFDQIAFNKKYQGFFYQGKIRSERADIRLSYVNASAALNLSRILEGEGIRVVDLASLDQKKQKIPKTCILNYNTADNFSQTIGFLKKKFGCKSVGKKLEDVDIEVIIGQRQEENWE